MLLNQAFSLREAPRALFWIGVFLISFFGMFYLGLNPELIEKWYLVLVLFNVIMSGVAIFYITLSMRKLKQNTEEGVIGSRFTWSFIRIVPVLVLLQFSLSTFFHLDQSETTFKLLKISLMSLI
jgi:phage shock protein PspC (stress-responsive transcriptional regulator)